MVISDLMAVADGIITVSPSGVRIVTKRESTSRTTPSWSLIWTWSPQVKERSEDWADGDAE